MITMQVKARIVEFVPGVSNVVEYTVNTVNNETGAIVETLGPVLVTGMGPTDITGDLNIDMSGVITNAINKVVAKIAAASD